MINRAEKVKLIKQAPQNNSYNNLSTDFSKIKVGLKTLDDAVYTFSSLKKIEPRLADKKTVLEAIHKNNVFLMRDISNFFYKTSGIYNRLCRYMGYLYRYDWMITPYINDNNVNTDKVLSTFHQCLTCLDEFGVKKFFGEVALKVVRNGCYYGYVIRQGDGTIQVQELPPNYCRSRYSQAGKPAIEFNMQFFDDQFKNSEQKMKILNLFPKEFKKGYILYKEGKLGRDEEGTSGGWYLLDINSAIKFNINGEDFPMFISVIPALIDLDHAQGLERKKMEQQLFKIIIQKMPIDKNGDLVFSVEEAQALHNNAVSMLGKAINVDVLTTFADTEVADLADNSSVTSIDELEKMERIVFNESGTAQNLFNTDGNLALEKSILNDEASMYNLLLQFEQFLNDIIKPFNKTKKKFNFRAQILTTTIYNYKEMAKLYKEQTQLGYSKMLPQIALGQSQSSILANAFFENDILDLLTVFIPPLMSSTMNGDILSERGNNSSNATKKAAADAMSDSTPGRKALDDDQKSEKTLQNQESMS